METPSGADESKLSAAKSTKSSKSSAKGEKGTRTKSTKGIKATKATKSAKSTDTERKAIVNADPTKRQSFVEEVDTFLSLKDEELAALPEDKVIEIMKGLNPYGRTIEGSDKYVSFSITQLSHEYWKKLVTTSMIGYLNRMCDEWKVPASVPVVSVYDYLDDPKKLDTPELAIKRDNKPVIQDYEFNREWMKKRIIVKEFLEEMFQFNPDEHVRSMHRPNYADKTRTPLNTMAARLATKHLEATDPEFKAAKALHDDVVGVKTKKIRKVIKSKDGKIREIIKEVPIEPPIDKRVDTNPTPLDPAKPKDPNVTSTVTNFIPPHDMFGRFKMYMTENYEELRDAVKNLYGETPDLELAINPYAVHDTMEEADAFKKKHSSQVIAEIFTAHTGKWNLFDAFKQQRESVRFFNKDTIVLEEMIKQIERDEKLGQDLMKKRVKKEKKKNIAESGPDAENFRKWREENTEIQKLGAKHIGDMADEDMPEDSIQVDVWRVAKGGLEIVKDKFYSKAEAPEFVKEAQDKLKADALKASGAPEPTPAVPAVPAVPVPPMEPRADNL
jgi:hypothetical protein